MLQGRVFYRIEPSLDTLKSRRISNSAYILYRRVYSLLNLRLIQTSVFLRRHRYVVCAGTGQDIKHIDIFDLMQTLKINRWERGKGENIVVFCEGGKWDLRTRVY